MTCDEAAKFIREEIERAHAWVDPKVYTTAYVDDSRWFETYAVQGKNLFLVSIFLINAVRNKAVKLQGEPMRRLDDEGNPTPLAMAWRMPPEVSEEDGIYRSIFRMVAWPCETVVDEFHAAG